MKTSLITFALLLCGSVIAQTNQPPVSVPPAPAAGFSLLLTLIPLVVPLLIATAKYLTDKLPSWSLPILAAALGALLNYVIGLAGQPNTTILNGTILGAAGVGLREIINQVQQKILPDKPSAS